MDSPSRNETVPEAFPSLNQLDTPQDSPLLQPTDHDEYPHAHSSHFAAEHTPEPQRKSYRRRSSGRRGSSHSSSPDLEMSRLRHEADPRGDEEVGFIKKQDPGRTRTRTLTLDNGVEIDLSDLRALSNKAFIKKATINTVLILLWYLFSVSISVYNKWMFAGDELDFHFPLFITSGHMIVQFGLASLVLYAIPSLRPRQHSLDPSHIPPTIDQPSNSSPERQGESSKPLMTWTFYLTRIAPCAGATGLDIGLGNTSLRFVTLIFFTMCKSSTLGFVLLFAIIFRLEKASWKLAGIIAIMTVGVIMMVAGETAFSALGFVLLMMASFFSGLRWSLTQILLRRNPATSNPFASLFFLTPIMFGVLFILAIPIEGFRPLHQGFVELAEKKGTAFSLALLIFPGVLAFLMTSAEFALLQRTSVVTLSVCGIFKEVITIAAGGIIFDETLTPINISGLFVTIMAIALYNYIRVRRMKKKANEQAENEIADQIAERSPTLSSAAGPHEAFRRDGATPATARDLIKRSLSHSSQKPSRVHARDLGTNSSLGKPPEAID